MENKSIQSGRRENERRLEEAEGVRRGGVLKKHTGGGYGVRVLAGQGEGVIEEWVREHCLRVKTRAELFPL